MKIVLTLALLLFFAFPAMAQQPRSFEILNPEAYPGDTVVVRIEPQWQGPMVCIAAFNNHHTPNDYGHAFIGVPITAKLGKEQVFRVECGRGVRLDSYIDEITVLEKTFTPSRTARSKRGGGTMCSESKLPAVRNAYSDLAQSLPDLTGGISYRDPTDLSRDIIDDFGFIYENNPKRPHCGVDLRMSVGTKTHSVNKGVVVVVGKFRAEGNMIIINHGLGIFSVYMHLSRINVKAGDVVEKGQIVGLSGRTGAGVREPHLHFNIRIHDFYVDPLNFIDTVNKYLK